MNQIDFDPMFSAAVRSELDAWVTAPTSWVPFWRRHLGVMASIFAGASILIGGGAAAAGLLTMPGAQEVTEIGATVVETHTGSAVVQLGAAPDEATNVLVSLTCLTPGTFTFDDGASISCGVEDVGRRSGGGAYSLSLPKQESIGITTAPEAGWTISVAYVSERTTDWATNANGDTYGAINEIGEPDLILVTATNGDGGYVYAAELAKADGSEQAATFASPEEALAWQDRMKGESVSLPVFQSDGETRIGEFIIRY